MSSKTKLVVLKSKELIYTGIFILLGILLIVLLFYMFKGDSKSSDKDISAFTTTEVPESPEVTETMVTYKPGVYSSQINLGGSLLMVSVTVDKDAVSHVSLTNLEESVAAMYPLLEPSLDEINNQISLVSSIDDITYSSETHYTTVIILDAVKNALDSALVE